MYFDLQCYNDSHADLQGLFATGYLQNVARQEAEAARGKKTSRAGFKMWLHACLATVGKTIWDRYDGPCTDDDAIVYYEAALPYLVELAVLVGETTNVRSITWASQNAPVMILGDGGLADDDDRAWFAEQEARAVDDRFSQLQCCFGRVHLPNGSELGKLLAIRAVEMRRVGMRGVTPIDRTVEQLADDRRAADLIRKQNERAPQESSPTRLKVWERVGIGQTKYKKLKAAGRLPEWPDIPRGIDPTPYVAAWVRAYHDMHPETAPVVQVALAA